MEYLHCNPSYLTERECTLPLKLLRRMIVHVLFLAGCERLVRAQGTERRECHVHRRDGVLESCLDWPQVHDMTCIQTEEGPENTHGKCREKLNI